MDLQCSLEIGVQENKKVHQLKLYTEDCLFKLSENEIETIPEYKAFDILVKSDNSEEGYFELPELEDYEVSSREEAHTSSSHSVYRFNQAYCIYANNWENRISATPLQTVALTPGFYTVHIVLDNSHDLYAYWYISPKELTTPEWQVMRNDVEVMVKGLALDYSRQMHSKTKSIEGKAEFKGVIDDDTAFLISSETRIRYAIETLRNEAKFRISKTYSWMPAGIKNEIDQQTIRKIGERPDKRGMLYTPKRYLEYDVAANRWLKLFLTRLVKYCDKQIAYMRQMDVEVKNEYKSQRRYISHYTQSEKSYSQASFEDNINEISETLIKLKKLQEYLRIVLEDAFLKKASMPNNTALPKALMLNASYNVLYKIYMVLFQHKTHFILAKSYEKYWKKTAQLYEIWTFISVISSLIRQGFQPIQGWIYNRKDRGQVLPFLNEGTQISFSSKNTMVNLTYNERIPMDKRNASLSKPLTTVSSRNKPDIRLDVIDFKSRYLGSVLFDAKYIRLGSILENLKSSERSGIRNQFTSYANDTNSPFFDEYDDELNYFEDIRAVKELLVLYPSDDLQEKKQEESKYTGHNVKYIQMRPGGSKKELDSTISENIRKIRGRANFLNR